MGSFMEEEEGGGGGRGRTVFSLSHIKHFFFFNLGVDPGLGRSPGEGKGYPLHYSGLENSTDHTVHGGHKELDRTERLSLSLHSAYKYSFMG